MLLIGIHQYPAAIAAGQSLSGPVPMGADTPVGIWMPPAWTPAALTFQVSPDGGTTWLELQDGLGTAVSVIAAAGQFIQLTNYMWRAINMIQIRSGTLAAPVVQVAAAIVVMIGRPEIV